MNVEILFPEVCSLFGDYGNILFLEKNIGTIHKTPLNQTPKFISEDIDLIYMGAMSESTQIDVLNKLMPYQDVLKDKIDKGLKVLFTGNAMDLLGEKIVEEDGSEIKALGFYDFKTILKRSPRLNATIVGKPKDGLTIVGHKTQFTQTFGDNELNYFCKTEIGMGMNQNSQVEGIMDKGVVATNLIGPLLILNPDFAKSYLNVDIAYYDQLMDSKNQKIKDIRHQ